MKLTKREHFAGLAMQGDIAQRGIAAVLAEDSLAWAAVADALIAALAIADAPPMLTAYRDTPGTLGLSYIHVGAEHLFSLAGVSVHITNMGASCIEVAHLANDEMVLRKMR